jgi:hypothetical protein
MSRMHRLFILPGFMIAILLVGCSFSTKPRTFENETFSFTIPAHWKTIEEIWDIPDSSGQDSYSLGVQEIVTIQYPTIKGKGKAYFLVASSPLQNGQDLESRLNQAYQTTTPEVENVEIRSFDRNELSGYEITYKRPWGEPWWKFRDIWLEKNNTVYVLSFHAPPDSFDKYNDIFEEIIGSFQFKD